MGLQGGQSVGGGGYLDWKELTREGEQARLAVFRVVDYMDPEPGDFGPKLPVRVDVMICDGDEAGEVHEGEKMFGAPSGPLRGVKNPKRDEPIPAPKWTRRNAEGFPVDDNGERIELVFRVNYVKGRKGFQPFIGLDAPSQAEIAAASAIHRGGAGWAGKATSAVPVPQPTQQQPAVQQPVQQQPVQQQAPVGGQMPWEKTG